MQLIVIGPYKLPRKTITALERDSHHPKAVTNCHIAWKTNFHSPCYCHSFRQISRFHFSSQVSMQPTPNTQMADSASNNSTDSSLSLVRSLHPNPQSSKHSNMTHSGLCKLHTTNYVACTSFEENKKTKTGTYYQVSSDTLWETQSKPKTLQMLQKNGSETKSIGLVCSWCVDALISYLTPSTWL